MVNKLAALLDRIGDFNAKAVAHKMAGDALGDIRNDILADAKELGIKHLKASAMLDKVSTKHSSAGTEEEPQGDGVAEGGEG